MIALPDVNVLIALAWENHAHHDMAHEWFRRESSLGWSTCLLTQSAFLRLSMNPQVVKTAIDFPTARQLLARMVSHPNHSFLTASPPMESEVFDEIAGRISGYRQISDAVLLLVARVADVKLITMYSAITNICPWPEQMQFLSQN